MKYVDALATFWQRNAELRHGHLPRVGDVTVPEPPPRPTPTPIAQPAAAPAATTTQPPESTSLLSKALPYVLALTVGGGGAVAVPWALDKLSPEPAAVQQEKDGSLYQYLEDRGDHLPQ